MKKTKFAGTLCAILLGFGPAIWVSQAQALAPEVLHDPDIVFDNGQVADHGSRPATLYRYALNELMRARSTGWNRALTAP